MKDYQLPPELYLQFPTRRSNRLVLKKQREERQALGQQIRQLREDKNWSLIDVMKKTSIGLGINTLNRLEFGVFRGGDIHDLQQIAYAYGKELKIVFEDTSLKKKCSEK